VTDDSEPRTVSLTFSGPEYERLQLEATDEGVAVDEWLKQAARFRVARIDTDLAHSIETDITVELPKTSTSAPGYGTNKPTNPGKTTSSPTTPGTTSTSTQTSRPPTATRYQTVANRSLLHRHF